MKGKDIICDASSLIALTESCFLWLLYDLNRKHGFRFLIPDMVEYECIRRPLNIKEYSMDAIRLEDAVNDGVLEVIRDEDINSEMVKIMNFSNHLYYARGKPIHLVDRGEAAMIALADKYDIDLLLMDERTTRLLIEDPMSIKKHFENEFNVHIGVNETSLRELQSRLEGLKVIRSSEIITLGYRIGLFNKFQHIEKDALEAALYRVKFRGCSISFDEINEILQMVD